MNSLFWGEQVLVAQKTDSKKKEVLQLGLLRIYSQLLYYNVLRISILQYVLQA